MTYTVMPEQSLLDVAIEVYGDAQGVFWLLEDNRALNEVADRLYPGQLLQLRDDVLNVRQKTYLETFGPFQTISEQDQPEGVGYWRLDDYIIQ